MIPFWTSTRFGIGVILSFGCFIAYAMRNNINIAIVCMVNQTAVKSHQNVITTVNKTTSECNQGTTDTATIRQDGEFVWSKEVQGQILSAFFWPYALSQIPSGIIVTKMGAKVILGVCMTLASLVTILVPILSEYSYIYTMVLRGLLGVFQASYAACIMHFMGHWVHPTERARMMSFIFAGERIGIISAYLGTGFLCEYKARDGWKLSFYIFGTLNFCWSIIWLIFTDDSPEKSKRITDKEKEYIKKGLENGDGSDLFQTNSIPWRKIFTSIPVLAVLLSLFTSGWANHFMTVFIPTYIEDVFNLNLEENGIITAVTAVPQCFMGFLCGWLADFIHKRWLSIKNTRKLFTFISAAIPAILLTSLGFVDCSLPTVAVVIMVLGMAVRSFKAAGNEIIIADFAPRYAGLIYSLANTASAIAGYIMTIITSNITKNSLREEWRISFFVTAAVEIFGGIFFVLFATSDVQSWASTSGLGLSEQRENVEVVKWRQGHTVDTSIHDGNDA